MQVSPEVNGHFITSTKGRGSGKPPFRTGFFVPEPGTTMVS